MALQDRPADAGPARPVDAADEVERDVERILRAAYRPFERASDLVQALVDALVEHKRLPAAEAHVAIDDTCVRARHPQPGATGASSTAQTSRWPIVYHERALGELVIHSSVLKADDAEQRFRVAFTRMVGHLLQRYEVRASARAELGLDLWFVGLAPALRLLEARLEEVAALPMPLLIDGEFGCETRTAAFTAHVASRAAEPFHELRCGETTDPASFRASLDRLAGDLDSKTLFLSDVDELDPGCQKQLLEFLGRAAGAQMRLLFDTPTEIPPQLRVIASTSRNLKDLSEHGGFSKRLWAALDYLRLRMPPLRERRDDIPFFLDYFAALYGQGGRRSFSPEATAILAAWNWSGNVAELERTLARLMATTRSGVIDTDSLRAWAAELMPDAPELPRTNSREVPHESALDREPPDSERSLPPVSLARQLLAGRFDDIDSFHPGLQRALRYLADHFHEEIALERLARESFVSPSYLCALFKKSLGMGFKRFQSNLRVEKAKELLLHKRHHRITDISLEVGFGDFSHFLKTFKRIIHISPREFRKRQASAPPAASDPDDRSPRGSRS